MSGLAKLDIKDLLGKQQRKIQFFQPDLHDPLPWLQCPDTCVFLPGLVTGRQGNLPVAL